MIETKVCSKCKEEKPLSEFNKAKRSKDGHFVWCRCCSATGNLLFKERNRLNITPKNKVCPRCNELKDSSDFSKSAYSKDHLSYECKKCKNDLRVPVRIVSVLEKNCKKCNTVLSSESFFKDTSSKDGLRGECKNCHASKTEEYKIKRVLYDKKRRSTESHKEKRRSENNRKYNEDCDFKIKKLLRDRLCKALKNNQKSGSAVDDLGCTISEFKVYLENKFYVNKDTGEIMSWKNHSFYGWHIDHIKPLSLFDLSDRTQLLEACHYTNMQPLWAKENLEKGNKYER